MRTLPEEEFVVVIAESRNPRGSGWFVTFFETPSSEWERERTKYRKTHPTKGGPARAQKKKGR